EERKSKKLSVDVGGLENLADWEVSPHSPAEASFVGYETVEIDTQVTAVKHLPDGRVAMLLRESPFYAESGGQISDHGEIIGDGWRVEVEDVCEIDARAAGVRRVTSTVP